MKNILTLLLLSIGLVACAPSNDLTSVPEQKFTERESGIYLLVSHTDIESNIETPISGQRITITINYWTVENYLSGWTLEAEGHGPVDFATAFKSFTVHETGIEATQKIGTKTYLYKYVKQ